MKFEIRKLEVYKEVEKLTSLIGASTSAGDGESAYNAVTANEYDSPVLNTFWIEATGNIINMLMRYLDGKTLSHSLYKDEIGEVFGISLKLPKRFDMNLTGSIENGLKLMLADLVTAGWMGLKLPDRKAEFVDKANEIALDVKMKILNKIPQKRELYRKSGDNYRFNQYEECRDCDSQRRSDK